MPPRKTRMLPGRRTPERIARGHPLPCRIARCLGWPRAMRAAASAGYCFCVSAGGAAIGAAGAGLAVVFFLTAGFFFIASRRAAGS